MERFDIINEIISKHNTKNYLEIGVRHGTTYNFVRDHSKMCYLVDLNFLDIEYTDNTIKYEMSSDEFFNRIDKNLKFDYHKTLQLQQIN